MIGHLPIRDHTKQMPADSMPEYAAVYALIPHLWQVEDLVLIFEPNVDLRDTPDHASSLDRSHRYALTLHTPVRIIIKRRNTRHSSLQ